MLTTSFRSFTAIFTAFYLLLSTGACAVKQDEAVMTPAPGVPRTDTQPVSVNILQSDPDISYRLQQAVEAYAEERGGAVSFHVQTISSREDYRAALRSRLLAGEEVDLFHLLDVSDVDRLAPHLEDLSTLPWVEEATGGTLDAVQMDGGIYGVPHALKGVGLIVDRTIFEAAGISLEGIRDFESLSAALLELRDLIDAGELRERFPELEAVSDFAAQDADYLSRQVSELMLARAFSGTAQAGRALSLSLPEAEGAEEVVKLLARTSSQRTDWKQMTGVSGYRMVEQGLAVQRVALVFGSTELYRRVYTANPEFSGRLALLPVYYPESEQGLVFAGADVWWAVRAVASDEVKEEAKALLSWLYASSEGGQVLADDFGLLSPYRAQAPAPEIGLQIQLLSVIDSGIAAPMLAVHAPSGWSDFFASELRAYFTEYEKEWAEIASLCQSEWSARR